MVEGTIIKGVGGFYYVKSRTNIYECRARGLFREEKIRPLIGDRVIISISEEDNSGYIEKILERKSQLVRPPVANVTQVIIVVSVKRPDINYWLLDRFIVMAEHQNLTIKICLNKIDLAHGEDLQEIDHIYKLTEYPIIMTSTKTGRGMKDLMEGLKGNVTVLAGPSGVGKSSLLNRLYPELRLKTGDISQKTARGKHTTRHIELIDLGKESFVLDTPGFSSLNIDFIDAAENLGRYFKEIEYYSDGCQFINCLHDREPNCQVKNQVKLGNISEIRYSNYLQFLEEIKNIKRF